MRLQCSRCLMLRDPEAELCPGCGRRFLQVPAVAIIETAGVAETAGVNPTARCPQCQQEFAQGLETAFCSHCGYQTGAPSPLEVSVSSHPLAAPSQVFQQEPSRPSPPQISPVPFPTTHQSLAPQFQVLHCSQCQATLLPGSTTCIGCGQKFAQPVPHVQIPGGMNASAPSFGVEEQPKLRRQKPPNIPFSVEELGSQFQPATQSDNAHYAGQLPLYGAQPPSERPLPLDIKFFLMVIIASIISFIAWYHATAQLPHYFSQMQDEQNAIGGAIGLPFGFLAFLGLRKLTSLLVHRIRLKNVTATQSTGSMPGHSAMPHAMRRQPGLENIGLAFLGGLIIWGAVVGIIPSMLSGSTPAMLSLSLNRASALPHNTDPSSQAVLSGVFIEETNVAVLALDGAGHWWMQDTSYGMVHPASGGSYDFDGSTLHLHSTGGKPDSNMQMTENIFRDYITYRVSSDDQTLTSSSVLNLRFIRKRDYSEPYAVTYVPPSPSPDEMNRARTILQDPRLGPNINSSKDDPNQGLTGASAPHFGGGAALAPVNPPLNPPAAKPFVWDYAHPEKNLAYEDRPHGPNMVPPARQQKP